MIKNNTPGNPITDKITIGITHGDINGISYEIILKSLTDPRIFEFFTPVIYGSPKVAAYFKKVMKLSSLNLNHIHIINKANPKHINIINCTTNKIRVELGKSTEMAGKSALNALRHAMVDLKNKKLDAIVTAPINKNNIQTANFKFPGHTEYFADECGISDVLMLMVHKKLRIGVVTGHVPISKVAENITTEKIVKKLTIMNKSLTEDFGINKPLIAVLSLNPHAGDDGLIGDDDQKIVLPAIQEAKEAKITAVGPYPADGFFGTENYKKFDAILAMYHDQGLIPFKILTNNKGVNFTAGLPIIRTSPAHGTAYELAGNNIATHDSFQQALYLARDIYKNRKMFGNNDEIKIIEPKKEATTTIEAKKEQQKNIEPIKEQQKNTEPIKEQQKNTEPKKD